MSLTQTVLLDVFFCGSLFNNCVCSGSSWYSKANPFGWFGVGGKVVRQNELVSDVEQTDPVLSNPTQLIRVV